MSGRAIFEKSMGEGKGSQRWFKDEIFDVLRERGIDPFMVMTGLPVTKEEVKKKMTNILEKFGDVVTDEADTERIE